MNDQVTPIITGPRNGEQANPLAPARSHPPEQSQVDPSGNDDQFWRLIRLSERNRIGGSLEQIVDLPGVLEAVASRVGDVGRMGLGLEDVLLARNALESFAKVRVRPVLIGDVEDEDVKADRVRF